MPLNRWSLFRLFIVDSLLIVLFTCDLQAVIRVHMPPKTLWRYCRVIMTGRAAKSCEGDVLSLKNHVILKHVSDDDEDQPRQLALEDLEFMAPADAAVSVGSPIVIMLGRRNALVHLLDQWWTAKSSDKRLALSSASKTMRKGFPGRTAALAEVFKAIAAGRQGTIDGMQHELFKGGVRNLGTFMSDTKFILPIDMQGDDFDDLLLVNSGNVQLLLNDNGRFCEAAAERGLSRACGNWAAAGTFDRDDRLDILIGNQIWLQEKGGFVPGPFIEGPSDILTAALTDISDDSRADVLLLSYEGILYQWLNEGATLKPMKPLRIWRWTEDVQSAVIGRGWTYDGRRCALAITNRGVKRFSLDGGGQTPEDEIRLTGMRATPWRSPPPEKERWDLICAVGTDHNADGLTDFFFAVRQTGGGRASGGTMLANRGFGVFLVHENAGMDSPWDQYVTRGSVCCAADVFGDEHCDLVWVTPEGTVFVASQPELQPPD